jgi:chorismate mutase-like protein
MTQEEAMQALAQCRTKIDALDIEIVELLNRRARVVEYIGEVKREANLPVYEPRREDEVFHNVTTHNRGPLPEAAIRRLFERIIDEARALQRDRMLQREKESQ